MFRLDAACLTDIGKVRRNNEDNLLFHKTILEEEHTCMESPLTGSGILLHGRTFAVFDGIGGEANGESASFSAALCARGIFRHSPFIKSKFPDFLKQACYSMNLAVVNRAKSLLCANMGTTLALVCFHGNHAHICNMGDSRIFRLRDNRLEQISQDHTDEPELRKRGISRKPGLTQYLGMDPAEILIEPSIASLELRHGDTFLICSDGLTDMVSNDEIHALLNRDFACEACVKSLVQAALARGGRDNVTVIVCRIQ